MSRAANICTSALFSIVVDVGDVLATLVIHPEDKLQRVQSGEIFRVRFTYTIGRPSVIDRPFDVSAAHPAGAEQSTLEVISVTPTNPNTDADFNEEQNGVVVARFTATQDGSGSGSDNLSEYIIADLVISMVQPEFGTVSSTATYWTDADADIPNLRSSEDGEVIHIAWDQPVDDDGNDINVDVDVAVVEQFEDGTRQIADETHFGFDPRTYTIDYEYLKNLIELVPGETEQSAIVKLASKVITVIFKIKRNLPSTVPPTLFNRDSTDIRFYHPLRTLRPGTALNLVARTRFFRNIERVELGWDSPPLTQPPIYDWAVRWKIAGNSDDTYTRWLSLGRKSTGVTIGAPTHPLVPGTIYTFQVRSVARFGRDNDTRIYGEPAQVTIGLSD